MTAEAFRAEPSELVDSHSRPRPAPKQSDWGQLFGWAYVQRAGVGWCVSLLGMH